MTVTVATLGFPRIGPRRELKSALESHWAGRTDAGALQAAAAALRAGNWACQRDQGADVIPSNDFSLYDHVLDMTATVGAIPAIYGWTGGPVDAATYFAMARGTQGRGAVGEAADGCAHGGCTHGGAQGDGVPAAEMTKWFDTNYHYLVPEFAEDQVFRLSSTKALDEYREARSQGIDTRPVLLGPVSYLLLGKARGGDFDPLALLDRLLPVYAELLTALRDAGAGWVQIDEPCLVLDLSDAARAAFARAYDVLTAGVPGLRVMLATYFGALDDNLATALALPVHGLHLDLVRAPDQLDAVLATARPDLVLSLGVIDGRNIWKADLNAILDRIAPVAASGRAIQLAPSCALLHAPIDLERETALDPDVKSWLAFAVQKVAELAVLARALNEGRDSVRDILDASSAAVASRRVSAKINDPAVQARVTQADATLVNRASALDARRACQRAKLNLPAYPTTTIGSFPQTPDIRKARAEHARGDMDAVAYEAFLRAETARAVDWQEEVGLDVLVHGEFERNDMVQYFGERLSGFAFTRHAWVQSYGSRYVRPPIIYGDVSRPEPMTVAWWRYAQSLTVRPMKGMLTGPVTILNWSFVRDDQPRSATCRQIAFAIRDEVMDLEAAGAPIIQIDEAALREGLPLRRGDWQSYLDWAVTCFRIAASGVADATQIHTHMCYSEFNDIIAAIGAMDADVISIETARSKMELLDAFVDHRYPADVGPGVYDIHSPREPAVGEMVALLSAAAGRLAVDQLWVNPDCGLKTRKWSEVQPAIANMVAAARLLRA
ncbi:5-methyltetrahydropteroyltriglutamate--homocysteine S-methyltransferase [Gluconacetobacter tumulisoli]|uniref:5-methyltetrahydropteroyltriglutamate--homocysteine methyltransferase n=1 Tax=Gluconacetobacter tumulisoli TaxID=1286189 RepID=A0A7W4K5X1_9PROT|nr:5-methyltetrahydropteroyltriglutamate--homocysteine S-methyltransferase [Gluconacetobacter tumulisoli]MBB2200946.1 5-methyltetrahydropteroyltriglutamate--homocysteine S-methyltransferase [Gluconacetobacter tumulisoli]